MDGHRLPKPTGFVGIAARAIRLVADGRPDEARELVSPARDWFGAQRPAATGYWLARFYVLVNDPDQATAELAWALEHGAWWSEVLLSSPALLPLQGQPAFRRALAESRRRRQAHAEPGDGPLIVRRPERPRGVLLVLHGAASRAARQAERWSAAVDEGMLLVVPESSQMTSSDRVFGWDDADLARREVTVALTRALAEHGAERLPLLTGGLSQGANLAIEWTMAGEPLVDQSSSGADHHHRPGVIALIPSVRDRDRIVGHLAGAVRRGVRGYSFVGEIDWARPAAQDFRRRLVAGGLDWTEEVMPGVPHTYPADFAERLTRALHNMRGDRTATTPES